MTRRVAIIQGHPDPALHFGHALVEAYAEGAREAGHAVREISIAKLDFPLLRSKDEWEHGAPPPAVADCQEIIAWSDHLVIVYPLWLGGMPALLKGFLEQTLRPGFALGTTASGGMPQKRLKGKSARIVVTMGMPAIFYRWYFRAHSLKSLERNILAFCGIGPIRHSLIGLIEGDGARRQKWLAKMRAFGRGAQ